MNVRSRLVELQKSLKRRLPINDSIGLSEVRQSEANPEDDTDDEENTETNLDIV